MSLEASVARLDLDALNDLCFIGDAHGVGRQRVGIDGTLDCFVDLQILERAAIAGRAFLLIAFSSIFGGVIRVGSVVLAIVLILLAGGLGFLLLIQFPPQSFDFIGQRMTIGTERLDHIEQLHDRLLRLIRQPSGCRQQLFDLFQNRFDIHSAHNFIIRNKPTYDVLALGGHLAT